MDFRQLEYFVTLSKLENFTRTAEQLHVSQPSVTKAIKALEAELQLTLIDRRQKHVNLTAEGKIFLIHAEKILQAVQEAEGDMKRFQMDKRGTVHFGIPPMVEAYLFPDLFTSFKSMYPDMNLDVKEYSDSKEVIKKAETGALDFGIIFSNGGGNDANRLLIMQDNMSLCVSKNLPLASKENISFADLHSQKFITQQTNTYQYEQVYERCVECGFAPDILLSTTQLKTIKELVAKEQGISILPDFVLKEETKFVKRHITPSLTVDICLIWGSNKNLNDMDKRFLNFMKHYISSDAFKQNF